MVFLAILLGIIIMLFLITLHEFGHFIMAKIFKVYIYEFAIGIGPKIISWKGKETRYSIRLFPFGGYVYTASEYLDPPKDCEDVLIPEKRFIEGVNRFKRILIVLSGILMNFNIAIILFTFIFAISKCSPNDLNGYGAKYYTELNSPAYILGLNNNGYQENSKDPQIISEISFFYTPGSEGKVIGESNSIIEQNAKIINNSENFNNFIDTSSIIQKILKSNSNIDSSNTIFIKYDFYNHITHKLVGIDSNDWSNGYRYDFNNTKYKINNHYIIGMTAPNYYFANSTEGYLYGWKKMFQESVSILQAFGKLFTGQWSQIVGPIGTISETKNFMNLGPESILLYIAILSANLFVLNLIPIPPLDGFKFMTLFIESCIRKELNQRLKLFITIIGLVLFLTLFIGLTIKDIFF